MRLVLESCFRTNFYQNYQIKIPIDFWYKQGLNYKFLIQLLETLATELTETNYQI